MNYLIAVKPAVIGNGEVPTMSSREIAELTGKNHADVMRDIRGVLTGLELVASNFAGYYKASNGKRNPEYNLPRRETELLLMGYSIPMRAKVYDRWQELESSQATPPAVLTNEQQLAKAVLLATTVIAEKDAAIATLSATVTAYKPAHDFANAVCDNMEDLETIQEFSARTKLGRNRLFALLRDERIILKEDAGHTPMREYIERGFFEIKEGKPFRKEGGQLITYKKVLITKRGLAFMWKKFGSYLFDSESAALNVQFS